MICWNVTPAAIDTAERLDADPLIVAWARSFVEDRG